jgi:hypothetical protein
MVIIFTSIHIILYSCNHLPIFAITRQVTVSPKGCLPIVPKYYILNNMIDVKKENKKIRKKSNETKGKYNFTQIVVLFSLPIYITLCCLYHPS